MRVFLDANILFSASDESSATRELFNRVLRDGHELVTSPHAWEEARRNLEMKRPKFLSGMERIRSDLTLSHAFQLPEFVRLEEKDKPILAGAVGAECSHLWTSDRMHFGHLYGETVHGVKIVSSLLLLDTVSGQAG